jgi:hypothetical protein
VELGNDKSMIGGLTASRLRGCIFPAGFVAFVTNFCGFCGFCGFCDLRLVLSAVMERSRILGIRREKRGQPQQLIWRSKVRFRPPLFKNSSGKKYGGKYVERHFFVDSFGLRRAG